MRTSARQFGRIGCIAIVALAPLSARTQDAIVGANLVNEPYKLTTQEQDSILNAMTSAGVRVIRSGIPNTEAGVAYAERVYAHGIKIEWLLGVSSPKGNMILSTADPALFRAYFQPALANMESKGIVFTGFELGNEINWSNHDLGSTGRVLGKDQLLHDPEGQRVAQGYLQYIKVLKQLKDLRDHSRLNQRTPIITAGMGEPSAAYSAQKKRDAVELGATIQFLRANGVDQLVDAYGIHWYPQGNAKPADRLSDLQKFVAECSRRKPCWMTEWGLPVSSGKACPVVDAKRVVIFTELRNDFGELVREKRLTGIFFYTWQGDIHDEDPYSAFLCGGVTRSGRLAVAPM